MYNNNVHPIQRTCDTSCNYKRKPLPPGHCSSCGNTGKCKKGCGVEFTAMDTRSLQKPLPGTTKLKKGCMRFCNDSVLLTPNDPNYISANQSLAGPANPKTLIPPVVVPPATDLDHWRANNLINHSHINTESQWDTYLSGYEVSNCCDRVSGCIVPVESPQQSMGTIIENFEPGSTYIGISDPQRPASPKCNPLSQSKEEIVSPTLVNTIPFSKTVGKGYQGSSRCDDDDYTERYSAVREKNSSEGYEGYTCKEGDDARDPLRPHHLQHVEQIVAPTLVTQSKNFVRENFESDKFVRPNESDGVNTTCGYNPEQIKQSNLPSNLVAGNCERDDVMKQYNKNLFTQTIQPDVYTVNEVIEPINANMGISFTQQFEPMTCSRDEREALTFTEHDPRVFQPKIVPRGPDMSVTEANVYDPRFSGYGTSYRAYTDKNVGQTRFYYDDINSVRMPNYVVRSNIDHLNYADTYGPLHDNNMYGNPNTNSIRTLAQDSFLRSSLEHRDDLMERLMRKRNAEMWQVRKYPKSTVGSGDGKRC